MTNEVKGRVIAVPPAQRGMGQRGPWCRQTVVIEYENGRYPQKLALECGSSKAEDFGKLKVGDIVTIKYDVTSREYQDKYFTTANAFDWTVDQASAPASSYNNGPI